MATSSYTFFSPVTLKGSNGTVGNDLTGGGSVVITDADGSLTSQEPVASVTGAGSLEPLFYRGTVTLGGVEYPVFGTERTGASGSFYIASNVSLTGQAFNVNNDVNSSVTTPVCFLAGTLIATPAGERAVETLQTGDLVLTPDGPLPVRFLARTTCRTSHLQALGKMPIRISQNALGGLGPVRDTFLSPSHAVHYNGNLVEAGALINGTSVQQLTECDEFLITYYNIELASHGLITANGLQVESYFSNYRSTGFSRESWDNYDEYVSLYGPGSTMDELALPRIPFARQLPVELRILLQLNESETQESVPSEAAGMLRL